MASVPEVVVCFAHQRWSRNYEAPHELMNRCARERRAVFVEPPEIDTAAPDIELAETRTGVITLIPHMPPGLSAQARLRAQCRAVDVVLAHLDSRHPVLWYFDPAALAFTEHVDAAARIYAWTERDEPLGRYHQRLLDCADVVFTDGLPDHRRLVHHNVHALGEITDNTWPFVWGIVECAIADRDQLGRIAL